ncbi:MAG: GldG family protein [Oscillospiraceae bacterium]|nr:GldG family protein [Oscillospiraceae bacterium]
MKQKLVSIWKSRVFRQGSVATAITALVVAIIVALNLFVGVLAERHQWRLDLTAEQAFVLTQESRDFIAQLEMDLAIYVLTPETGLTAAGEYFVQANEVIRQYAALSPRITLEYIDLTRDPAFAARFPQFQLNAQTILLVTEDRVETLSVFELFNIETDVFGSRIASSRAEQMMTGLILFMTMDRQVTVSVLAGFGESDSSGLVSLLETNRYRVVSQNILTEEIHPEATILVINSPTRDYPEDVIAKIERFLLGERDVTLVYFAGVHQPPLPNLEMFLADWGILVLPGIVYQTDLNMTWGGPYLSAVHYTEDVFARHTFDFFSIMPNARPLDFLFHQRGARTVSAPMIFGESAVLQPLDAQNGWSPAMSEMPGPFAALALSQDEAFTGDYDEAGRVSTVAVFASRDFVDVNMLLNPHIGNAQYILGLFEGLSEHMGGVAIAPTVIGATPLPITDFQTIIYGVLFVIVLPLVVVFAGGVIFIRRRHL